VRLAKKNIFPFSGNVPPRITITLIYFLATLVCCEKLKRAEEYMRANLQTILNLQDIAKKDKYLL
jgi:hypothetical protein